MKTAFALRTHLGDPGPCTGREDCFLDLEAVLNDTLSEEYGATLRYIHKVCGTCTNRQKAYARKATGFES